MRKFILIAPLLFVSAGVYAVASADLTFAASETIEQIRPAEKPAVATEPPARTNTNTDTKTNTDANTTTSTRTRKAARPATGPRSARKSTGHSYESDENEARRMGAKYGITW